MSVNPNPHHKVGKGDAAQCLLLKGMPCPSQEGKRHLLFEAVGGGPPAPMLDIKFDKTWAAVTSVTQISFLYMRLQLDVYRLHPTLHGG